MSDNKIGTFHGILWKWCNDYDVREDVGAVLLERLKERDLLPPSPVVTDEQIAAIVDIVYGEMWSAVRPHMQAEIKDKIRAALQDKG